MKKVLILSVSILMLGGCNLADTGNDVIDNFENNQGETEMISQEDCVIGEVYSFDELSFDVCSVNVVTLGEQDGNLLPILMNNQKVADLVTGDFESEFVSVTYDDLVTSLEGNLFGGIEAIDDNGFGMNYIDIDGNDVIEVEMLGDNQGYRRYFSLTGEDILRYDDKLNVLAVVSGVIER